MVERFEQIQAKVNELILLANSLYNIDLPDVSVRFDLRGRAAGQAGRRYGQFFMRFNRDMIADDKSWEHMIRDTVPHELAHIVCFYKPTLGRNHDHGWKSVCRALGGSGDRCHSEQVVYAKGNTYHYRTTHGHTVTVSERIHKNLQKGHTYTVRGKGKLNSLCEYELYRPHTEPKLETKTVERKVEAAPEGARMSKSYQVRHSIARAKAEGWQRESVVLWAVEYLGMSKSLARTYVNNNWDRVSG